MAKVKNWICNNIIFCLLLIVTTVLAYRLFYLQAINVDAANDLYLSDMRAYMKTILGQESGFSFPYPVFFWVGRAFYFISSDVAVAIALATAFLQALAVIFCKLAFDRVLEASYPNRNFWQKVLADIVVVGIFFVSMIFDKGMADAGYPFSYLGAFSPNAWHNATYLAARPFMILAFFYSIRILQIYEDGFQKKYLRDYALFTVSLLLATMTKPSFTLVHMLAVFVFMLIKLIISRFSLFKQTLTVVLYYIPTLVDMLYQYSGVFTSTDTGEETGIGFGYLAVWKHYSSSMKCSIACAAAFPILVFVLNFYRKRKDLSFIMAWLTYIMGFLTSALLYEKGFRMLDFNFIWGYICGLFLIFLVSGMVMLENFYAKKWLVFIPEIIVFGLQLFCGIRYFYLLSIGHTYYEHLSLFW